MNRPACALLVALAAAAAGCVSAQAKGDPAAGAALAPPAPPPHTVSPVEIAAEPAAPTAPAGPAPVVVKPSTRPPASKAEKPAEKPAERPDAVAAPASPDVPPLQTTTNVMEVEKGIRARMVQASKDLERTDYRVLTEERRVQYDTAKRFIRQAEEALKVKNLVFAGQLAEKAATLAAALVPK